MKFIDASLASCLTSQNAIAILAFDADTAQIWGAFGSQTPRTRSTNKYLRYGLSPGPARLDQASPPVYRFFHRIRGGTVAP